MCSRRATPRCLPPRSVCGDAGGASRPGHLRRIARVNTEDLWQRALADAELDDSIVRRVALKGEADTSRYSQHFPPGATARPTMTDLTDEEAAEIDADTSGHRVAHVSTTDHEPGSLGMMRAQLEHVRQWDARRTSYDLSFEVNGSLNSLYGGRAGGAGLQRPAADTRRHRRRGTTDPRGLRPAVRPLSRPDARNLYRTDRAPGSFDTLPQRTVVFGAIHAEALDEWASASHNRTLGAMLSGVHADAPQWWQALLGDDLFGHLRKSAPAFNPSVEEIQSHGGSPAEAWRPLEALLDRAHEHGLWLLNRNG
jgi:hypothetical protein